MGAWKSWKLLAILTLGQAVVLASVLVFQSGQVATSAEQDRVEAAEATAELLAARAGFLIKDKLLRLGRDLDAPIVEIDLERELRIAVSSIPADLPLHELAILGGDDHPIVASTIDRDPRDWDQPLARVDLELGPGWHAAVRLANPDRAETERRRLRLATWILALCFVSLLGAMTMYSLERTRREITELDEKRTVLACLSHELRSPLTAIRLHADLALAEPGGDSVEALLVIRDEAERLGLAVDSWLSMAHLDTRVKAGKSEEVDIVAIVERVLGRHQSSLEASGLCIEFSPAANPPPIATDGRALETIIDNLVRNVRAHAASGGLLAIEIAESAEKVIVSVVDAGPGVEDSELERIFEPFVRGAATDVPGFGLGLALSKRLADSLGIGMSAHRRQPGLELRLELSPFRGR